VEALVNEALRGKHRRPAVEAIFDRLEIVPRSTWMLTMSPPTFASVAMRIGISPTP
jgi:hypothetical protein